MIQVCGMCKRERTLDDVNDYTPLQVIMGKPVGWYSSERDGEMCGECTSALISKANRR